MIPIQSSTRSIEEKRPIAAVHLSTSITTHHNQAQTKPDALVLSSLDNFMHNIISLRNRRSSSTGAAPNGSDVQVELKYNFDFGGHDIYRGASSAESVSDCATRCKADTSCAAFTYVTSAATVSPNTCFMKFSTARSPVHEHGPAANHISGVVHRPGSVLAAGVPYSEE